MFNSEELQSQLELVRDEVGQADSVDRLSSVRKKFLSEILGNASKSIGKLDPQQRAQAGKVLSDVKSTFEELIAPRLEQLQVQENAQALEQERVDVSVAQVEQPLAPLGARHPLHTLMEQVGDFFKSIGWSIASGPEVESEWYNFDALNFGPDHPARQMQDTFFLKQSGAVLRTHTSPVQVRSLVENGVPLYIACPGRVFRTDELDATHTPVFHQCEGLAVDKNLTMAHLKGTIDAFAKAMFGPSAKTRLRPSYFPFTEPSAEMDVWYERKKGGAGWIEWGGCGMVNPNVLKSCGIDPEVYSGFAFGMGIERTLMLRHNIGDMHDIVEGDIRFSNQFGIKI
jgi:phenylalanyl-tRNA synthetase alpha chain